ncbi:MAG: PAS domain S-box protein, partial [Sulfuricellaceae bacterium]|nr:PAS domain S-box protein [Sulfuricellaceae bacterium]
MKKKNGNGRIEILIAEDSATQAELLKQLLEAHQYSVSIAANGKIALAQLALRQPALVISDILMPELDGYGLCKAIKSDEKLKDIPVILVTTLSDAQDVIRGLECGADNFIRKPYEEKYLLSRINYLLMNLELRKEQKMLVGVEINLGGQKYFINSERQQILDLLISTYEQAVHINNELKLREKELEHSNHVLNGLYRIAEGLNHALTEREVAEAALERALELPGVQAGWICMREGESDFRLVAIRNLPPAFTVPGALDGDCACRKQLLSGKFDAVSNIIECERLAKAKGDTNGLRYHATVPLWLGERAVGLMNLVGPQEGLFDEEELKVLHGVGRQLAVALERARLHEHLEQLVAERTAALRASEAHLRAIIEAEPECVKIVDAEGRLVQMNAAGLAMIGADSLESVQGGRIAEFVVPSQREAYRAFEASVLHGKNAAFEFEIVGLKGIRRWLSSHAVPLPEQKDGRPQMLGIARDVTERKQAEAKLKLFRTLLDKSSDAIEVLDPVTLRFLDINETGCRVLGYSREELLSMSVFDIGPALSADSQKIIEAQLRESGRALFETMHRRKDGSTFPVEVSVTSAELDKPYLLAITRDISKRKANEARIKRLNRIYSVLSGINTTIVRVREEGELFSEACRIAVEHGGFIFAWIGKFDADSQQVTPIAQAGRDDGYLAQINLTACENAAGNCLLIANALTEAKPVICNDIASDERMAAWSSEALSRGYRSVVVLPLLLEGKPVGVFVLYAAEPDAFDDDEMRLLVEMSADINYALKNYRLEVRRKQAEDELRKLSLAVEQSPNSIVITDLDANIEYVNEAFVKATGYSRAEVIGRNPSILHSGKNSRETYDDMWAHLTRGEVWKGEFINRRKDGSEYIESILISPVRDADGRATHYLGIKENITERKRMEKALLESEEKFRVMSASAQDAIIMIDNDGSISFWNGAAEKIFGYPAHEALGKHLHPLLAPARYLKAHRKGFAHFQLSGEGPVVGQTLELVALHKNGNEFPIELSLSAVEISGRWQAIGILRDITERKQAEVLLRNSETRLQTIVENLTEGIAVSDLDGRLLHFNRAALDLHGFTTLDECRQYLNKFADTFELSAMDGTVWPVELWPLARILRGESLRDLEVRIRHIQAGWRRVYNYGGTLVRDAGGQPLMALVTISDITESKRMETELRENEARYRRITEGLTDYQYTVRIENGRAVETTQSPACVTVTGYTVEEYAANPHLWIQMVVPEDRELVMKHVNQILAGDDASPIEHRITRKNGETRWIRDTTILFRDASGRLLSYDGVIKDITERKLAEESLRQLNDELESKVAARTADLERARREADDANRAKSAFLSTMSHEIRTPMNGVVGMVDVLAQSRLSEHQADLVKTVRESANTLLGIIDDILDFSKIEAGRMELERVPVSVADLVEGLCNSLVPVASRKGVELSLFI